MDDVTRAMSKGGVLVKNLVSAPGPPPPSKILDLPLYGVCRVVLCVSVEVDQGDLM